VRSLTPATRKILVDGIKRISRFEGLAAGLPESKLPEVMVSDEQTAPPLINNENLANRLKKSIGEKQGINIFHPLRQQMGAEDFAYFGTTSHKIPLTMIRLGIVPLKKYNEAKRKSIKLPSLHSPEIEFDISSIKTGIDTMTNSALELLKK
jgi:hippurate hydrolase